MIVCKECGNCAPSGDGFCPSCGTLLEWSGEAVATPPPPPPVAPPLVEQYAMSAGWGAATQYEASQYETGPSAAAAAVKPAAEAVRPKPMPLTPDAGLDGLYCSTCGTRNVDGRTFCRYCGRALDVVVAVPVRLRWWQRLLRREPRSGPVAGDRPRRFRRRDKPIPEAGTAKHSRRKWHLLRRLPLSRVGPLLIVLGLVGIGLGPARYWLTVHAESALGRVQHHVKQSYQEVTPVSATSSSHAPTHSAAAVLDNIPATWWQSADHPDGVGESLTVHFANPTNVDTIAIRSGADADSFVRLARPQTVQVIADGKPAGQVTFANKVPEQNAHVKLRNVTSVTLVITSVYPGQKVHACAIRDLRFFYLQ